MLTAPLEGAASPQSMAARLPPGSDAARAALASLPEPGHDLAAEIVQAKFIVPVVLGIAGRPPHIKARFVYRGTANPFGHLPRFGAASGPQSVLETNAAGSAAINLIPDHDGVLRRMPLVFQLGPALVPGMAAEVLRVTDGKPDITVTSNERDPLTFLTGTGIAGLETSAGTGPDRRQRTHAAALRRQCLRAHAQSQCADGGAHQGRGGGDRRRRPGDQDAAGHLPVSPA